MMIDIIAEAGGGLNPESDVRWCLCQGAAAVGFLFGIVQHMPSNARWLWGFIYAVAATIAALAGGMVGFWVYHALRAPVNYSFGYSYFGYGVSDTPERTIGIAAGFLVGMMVYGIVTGLAVAYSVPLMYVV
jgi:zinc transporter ZupT